MYCWCRILNVCILLSMVIHSLFYFEEHLHLSLSRVGARLWLVIFVSSDVIVKAVLLAIRCQYTKSNPIDDHSNISSKKLQKQNFKPLGHYTCMQCGTSHLQKVQENILSHIILATYRKFTVTTLRFTQNYSCNIFTHPIYQQVANVTV